MATIQPVLNLLDVVTRDFEASLTFYRRLGLEVPDTGPSPEGVRHADVTMANGFGFHLDNETLAGLYNAAWRKPGGSSRALIGFSVSTRDEVDRLYRELTAAGYEGRQPPYDAFWGARYAVIEDPDGNPVGLMSPIDVDRKSAPPRM